MLHFEGDYRIPRPVPEVAAQLGDASFLLSCLKDVESVVESGTDRAVWKLRPAFSFVTGTLEIAMTILERSAETARYEITSKGVGASSTVESTLSFQSEDEGTRVRWVAEIIALTGLLKLAPKSLIHAAAGKVIQETWDGIAAKMTG